MLKQVPKTFKFVTLQPTAPDRLMKIALFGKNFDNQRIPFVQQTIDALVLQKVELSIYEPYFTSIKESIRLPENIRFFHSHDDLDPKLDMLFSIGGDGTLLDTLPIVRDTEIPVLGINMGRLGFLSSISKQEIEQAILNITEKRYTIESRSMIQLIKPENLFADLDYALNELAVFRTDTTTMIVINVYVDDSFVNAYWADGLIIATPTGSTAYSLSAGGPIIVPSAMNFVITPIATHNLSVRPIVISDHSVIRLKVAGRHTSYKLSMDSRSANIDQSIEIVVKKAGFSLNLVKMDGKDFFGTIREKLLWGLDIRN